MGYNGFHTIPKSRSMKVNVITRLEFDLAFYDIAVLHISRRDSPIYRGLKLLQYQHVSMKISKKRNADTHENSFLLCLL